MTDRKALIDSNETPEDVATLYSWANLHGAKYRDFSASRAQTREKARQRVQDAIEAERRRSREEADAQKNAEASQAAERAILAEAQRKQEEAQKEQALKAEQQAAQQRARQAAQPERPANPPYTPAYQPAPQADNSYAQPQRFAAPPAAPSYSQPNVHHGNDSYAPPAGPPAYGASPHSPAYAQPVQPPAAPAREEQYRGQDHFLQVRNPWAQTEAREAAARPAWLSPERGDAPVPTMVPPAPEDTLQASRDRLTSRWFALNGLFNSGTAPVEAVPAATAQRAPVLAVFSLAGGVGKTSLVATLGRALVSARGTGSSGRHRGVRTASVLLWRARPASGSAADLHRAGHKRRCSDPNDHH